MNPPCLIFEDDHLLVVNKPAGVNTHAPSPFAGEGLYEWLRHREPRWADLAIIHRIDKETSGLILFSKTTLANRSLTEQFTARAVKKKYVLLTDRGLPPRPFTARSRLVRIGDKYQSRPESGAADAAETSFSPLGPAREINAGGAVEAVPLTGRTHQIRVHAAEHGFPILGDVRYGGTPWPRLCLHAAELAFRHPASGRPISFVARPQFEAEPALALRSGLINPQLTTAFRLIHGASDGWADWFVDRLGPFLLSQGPDILSTAQLEKLRQLREHFAALGVYHKPPSAAAREAGVAEASPQLMLGDAAPDRFKVLENGLQFELSFAQGYSAGLFLDQRDNRRRVLTRHVAAGFPLFARETTRPEVLNTFAYTCGFSTYAAQAGACTTSIDLSKKYLEWGKANFALNQLDPAEHDFIFGDVFDWLRRLRKKKRAFDLILLDPPTFSRSKESGPFRVEKNYGRLVAAALPLLKRGAVLFASCNAAAWPAEEFLLAVKEAIRDSGRAIGQEHYFPQPPDFPVSRSQPAYLKTYWARVS